MFKEKTLNCILIFFYEIYILFVDCSVYNHGVNNMRMVLPKNVPIYFIHSRHYDDLIFHPKIQPYGSYQSVND